MMKPGDFHIDERGVGMARELVDSLRKAELEFTATVVIHWHQKHGHEDWVPVSREEIGALFDGTDEKVKDWARNPFWRLDPFSLVEKGYFVGWEKDPKMKGTFTPKFFEDVEAAMTRRRAAAQANKDWEERRAERERQEG